MPDERDDYLWDKSGERDAEVERLERVLARYRYDAARDDAEWNKQRSTRGRRPWFLRALLLAAGLLIGLTLWRAFGPGSGHADSYSVTGVAGVARVGVGESLETHAESAVLRVAEIGDVHVEPSSRLRVEDTGANAHKLFLERGAVRATIFARPREFQIGTPSGLSIDLGCEYELAVDEQGRSTMTVLTGRVAFEGDGRRAVVPARATCSATRSGGPNVPVRVDADPRFVAAVRALEGTEQLDARDVETVLGADVRENSVSLFHLLAFTSSVELRAKLFERLSMTYPLPEGADASAIVHGNAAQIEAWLPSIARDWDWR